MLDDRNPMNRTSFAVRVAALLLLGLAVVPVGATGDVIQAVRRKDTARWRVLLREPSDVNARDGAGNTALHFAALNHDVAAVEALVGAGADVNVRNAAGATPLLYGAGRAEVVRLLLAAGAAPEVRSLLSMTPLSVAVAHPEGFESVERLLAAGVDPRAHPPVGRSVILNYAIQSGNRRTIDLLLAKGVHVDPEKAYPPMVAAATMGDLATVRRLLDRGADPNRDGGFAGHALNTALYAGHPAVALELIERGSDLGLRSPEGHGTPPMVWSAYNDPGDPVVARRLVERGVNVHSANDAGVTALDFALRMGPNSPLSEYLRSLGAKPPVQRREVSTKDRAGEIGHNGFTACRCVHCAKPAGRHPYVP